MDEQNEETRPLSADAPPPAPPVEPPAQPGAAYEAFPTQPAQPRVRRTLGLPMVGGIAAAALLIGGLAGGLIGSVAASDDHDGGRPEFGPGPGMQHDGQFQPPNGLAPDGQAPDSEQEDSDSDSDSDSD